MHVAAVWSPVKSMQPESRAELEALHTVGMTTDTGGGSDQDWTVKLRLAIDADDEPAARTIAEQVIQTMDVAVAADLQVTRSNGRIPYWNFVTDLDLSGTEPITPDDAQTRLYFVIRNLPGVTFMRPGNDSRTGLWQWLPDSWEMTNRHEELAHPAVRAAGIYVLAKP